MLGVDNATSEVVHHFLRSLTVKVSRTTVCRLLDSPLGNTMQGISDALNALHVNNVVYQLARSVYHPIGNKPFHILPCRKDRTGPAHHHDCRSQPHAHKQKAICAPMDRNCPVWRNNFENSL